MALKVGELTCGPNVTTDLTEIARGRQSVKKADTRNLLHNLEDARDYYPLDRINFNSKKLVRKFYGSMLIIHCNLGCVKI